MNMSTIVEHGSSQKRLFIALVLGIIYLAIVAVGSMFSNSLSLAATATHMVFHNGAIVIGLIATYYAKKSTQDNFSNGYNKAEALGGYTSAILLIIMAILLFQHALGGHEGHDHTFGMFDSHHEPHDGHNHAEHGHTIDGALTFAFGIVGFLIHLISMAVLRSRKEKNLCVHGAYMCIKYDVITIIMSIIVGIVVMFFSWHQLDIIVALIIASMLMFNAFRLLVKSGRQLLGSMPKHIQYDDVIKNLKNIPHVQGAHNLIIRNDGAQGITASVHLEMHSDCIKNDHWEPCQAQAEKILKEKYGITYCIFQLEKCCDNCK